MDRSVRRGLALIAVVLIAMAAILLVPKQTKKVHPPNDDPWVLVSYDPDNKFGTYLGNGFISTRIMGDGVGSQDGKPLPCFMAGLYDNEKLIPTPTWSDLRFYDENRTRFEIDKTADYRQTLNMKTGILTTYATWRAGSKTLKGKIEVIVSRAMPNTGAVLAEMVSDSDGMIQIEARVGGVSDRLRPVPTKDRDGSAVFRTKQSGIYVAVSNWLVVAAEHATIKDLTLRVVPEGEHIVFRLRRNLRLMVSNYSGLSSGMSLATVAQSASRAAASSWNTGDGFVNDHKAAWAKLWQKDIIIDGPRKDQQAIHSCMFYLLQSVREGSQWSIPPTGLSNNAFSGHVFWDADTWMFPALILQHPELARSIVDYRFNTLPGAMANAKASGYAGAEYAWESGYTGKEDTDPALVYRHERHITGDVALAQWQYYLATGDTKWLRTRGFPVIKATADYWASRVVFVAEKNRYEIKQVVPPDENAELVDNSAYTNAIARMNLEIAVSAAQLLRTPYNVKWQKVANKLYIPFDKKADRFVAFDGYKGLKAKQADTELLIYPLQFADTDAASMAARNTFDYYAPKLLPKGPAMSSSAHSVIAARFKNCDRAYTEFIKSYKPFLRGPFNYFNETPSEFRDNYCFLTGCAGPIQATIFGLAGAHIDYRFVYPSKASLTFHPCLPKQWKSVKITGVQWHGKTFDVDVTRGNKVRVGNRQQAIGNRGKGQI